jgi:hypothetical protein
MLGIAAACWVPAAMVDNSNGASPIWLICLIATASTCLVASVATACNAMRLYRLGIEELAHEARCAIRPRL